MRGTTLSAIAGVLGLAVAALVALRPGHPGSRAGYIVVASADLSPGLAIGAAQVKTIGWAADALPAGAFSAPSAVVGRVPHETISAGQPVLEFDLAKPNSQGGLTAMISEGMRAISIQADEISGVAGFVVPGSKVDVLVSGKDSQSEPFSRIVLQSVKVLAVEQDTAVPSTQPRVVRAVTLELQPEQSERLDLARTIGKLSLVLRNQFDTRPSQSRGARLRDIIDTPSPNTLGAEPVKIPSTLPPAPANAVAVTFPRRTSCGVEVIRGTSIIQGGC